MTVIVVSSFGLIKSFEITSLPFSTFGVTSLSPTVTFTILSAGTSLPFASLIVIVLSCSHTFRTGTTAFAVQSTRLAGNTTVVVRPSSSVMMTVCSFEESSAVFGIVTWLFEPVTDVSFPSTVTFAFSVDTALPSVSFTVTTTSFVQAGGGTTVFVTVNSATHSPIFTSNGISLLL